MLIQEAFKAANVVFKDSQGLFKQTKKAFQNGELFSGTVKGIAKNGDHIETVFKNGVLDNSKRVGNVNFVKEYANEGKWVSIYDASKMYVDGKNLSLAGRLGECKGSTRVDRISGDVVLKYDGNGNPIKYIFKDSQGEITKRDVEEGHFLPIII